MDFVMQDVAAQVFRFADQRLMPLVRDPESRIPEAIGLLRNSSAANLFPSAAAPEAALAGLWLGAGDWDEAHEIAQNVESPDGCYWHAIVHRQEPAAWNARYWFSKVGRHPIYPELAQAAEAKLNLRGPWDAARFVDLCGEALGTQHEQAVREVQQAEWRLLLLHCARSESR